MSRVMTFSTVFPSYHPKAGQPTHFVEKIWKSTGGVLREYMHDFIPNGEIEKSIVWGYRLVDGYKYHTIRAGHRWKVGDKFSPRVWSGKPYNSKMITIGPDIEIKKLWDISFFVINTDGHILCEINKTPTNAMIVNSVAKNDGLDFLDFTRWFALSPSFKKSKVFDGQIICWNESINY